MSTPGRPLTRLAGRFSSRKPSPWWLLVPTAVVTAVTAASSASLLDIYTEIICRSQETDPTRECNQSTHPKLFWKVAIAIGLSSTLLSWLTSAWWGSLSDRYGRTRILTLGATGSLVATFYLIVAHIFAGTNVPHISWLLVFGAIIQGVLGGVTTLAAVTQAYIADTTTEINRSTYLSIYFGLTSLGALIGAIFAKKLAWTPIHAQYVLAGVHAAYVVYLWTAVPDSVTDEEKERAQQRYEGNRSTQGRSPKAVKRVASLFNPVALLGPTTANTSGNPLRHGGKDWSLALLVLGFILPLFCERGFEFRVYTSVSSRWSHLSSSVHDWTLAAQVFALLVFFPVIKRSRTATPLVASSVSGQEGYQSIRRDFKIGRISLGILLVSLTVLSLFPHSLPTLAFPGLLGLFGIIFKPALISVIVSSYARQGGKETGRLLGGLGAIESVSAFVGNFVVLLLLKSRVAAILPATLLVASYSILCRARVPEVVLSTDGQLEEEERLVGHD